MQAKKKKKRPSQEMEKKDAEERCLGQVIKAGAGCDKELELWN